MGSVNGIETRFYIGKLKQESNVELYRGQRRFFGSSRKQDRISIFPPSFPRSDVGMRGRFIVRVGFLRLRRNMQNMQFRFRSVLCLHNGRPCGCSLVWCQIIKPDGKLFEKTVILVYNMSMLNIILSAGITLRLHWSYFAWSNGETCVASALRRFPSLLSSLFCLHPDWMSASLCFR